MTSSHKAAGSPRKRSPLRTLGVTSVALLLLLAAGCGWLYLKIDGNITSFGSDGIGRDRPGTGSGGQNVLVIGSDSRSGDNSEFGGGKGDVGRSDTAFLLHVYGDRKHAVAVSIPRDTLVDIPPCRLPDGSWTRPKHNVMFNSAFSVGETASGNPACTQNTVEKMAGVRVDHTVVVDFAGFAKMTDAVGGVPVCVPQNVYAKNLNPHLPTRGDLIFPKGPQTVSGQRALDYVRIRHGLGDGSDIGRIQRQQAFVASLIKKVKDRGLSPTTLLPLADAATKSMTVDPGLDSADKLLSFAMSLKDIDLHNTKFITLPWRYQGERVAVIQPQADALWADIRADRTIDGKDATGSPGHQDTSKEPGPSSSTAAPGTGISLSVYNGTTRTGLAARAAERLRAEGFIVTGTATAPSQQHRTTLVEYGPGTQDKARTVAEHLPGAQLRSVPAPGISVVLGRTYEDAPAPSTAAPTPAPSLGEKARSGDDDPCSGLSYG